MIISILLTILIGALFGWLGGLVMKSKHGFWINCLLGIVGSFIGFGIAGLLHLSGGLLVNCLISLGGTCLVIVIARFIFGKKW